MKNYRLQNNYYSCFCGGTFWVDLAAQIYGVAPALYTFVCDPCGKRKRMACEAEVKEFTLEAIEN